MSNVGYGTLQIIPSAKGFSAALNKEVSGPLASVGNKEGKSAGGKFRTGVLGSLKGMAGPMAALIGGAAVLGFFKDAVNGASDLSESTSKVGVVFKKSAGQVLAASKTSATGMGLSKQAYLEATGTLGNLLVALDVTPKKAADMSQQMVKLAGDLASFNNVSPEEALDALRAGLTGEAEPLKKFGVNMNATTLATQAMKMGLIKNVKEALTPQNKALAAQALIMAQTKTAQGDFARTSGGLANQQRILAAQFTDVKAKVGGVFLPIITKAVTFINEKVFPAFSKVPGVVSKFKDMGSKIVKAIGPIDLKKIAKKLATDAAKWADDLIGGFKTGIDSGNWKPLGTAIGKGIVAALKGIGDAVDKIGAAIGDLLDKVDWSALGKKISNAVTGMIRSVDWKKVGETLGDSLIKIFQRATTLGEKLGNAFKDLIKSVDWNKIGRDSTDAIGQFLSGIDWGKLAKTLGLALIKSLKVQKDVHDTIINALGDLVMGMAAEIGKAIGRAFKSAGTWLLQKGKDLVAGMKNGVTSEAGKLAAFFASLPGTLRAKLGSLAAYLAGKGAEFLNGLKNGAASQLGKLYAFFASLPGTLRAKLGSLGAYLAGKGAELLNGLKNGATGAAGRVYGFFAGLPSTLRAKLGNLGAYLSGKGAELLAGLKNGASSGFGAVASYVRSIPGKVVSAFGNAGSILYNAGAQIISGLVAGLRAKVGDVTSFLQNLTSKIPDWKGPAKTDKTLLTPTGAMIIAGLVNGMKSGEKGVKSYLAVVTKQIAGIWSSRVTAANAATKAAKASITRLNALAAAAANGSKAEKSYKAQAAAAKRLADVRQAYADKLKTQAKDAQRAITTASAGMLKQAALHDTIIAKLTDARKKLSDLIAVRNEYATGIADSLKATASLTSFQPEEGKAPTIGNLKTFLTDRLAAIKKFAADMATLRKKGVSDTIIKDLESKGIEASATTAAALAAGSKTDIAQINSLQAAVDAQANLAGKQAAAKWFDTGINAAQGVVKGIESQLKAVDAVGVKLAKTLADAIRKALKIKSPSRVLKKLGSFSGQGLTVGLEGERRRVYEASAGLAKAVVAGSKGLPIASASHAGAIPNANTRAVAGNDVDITVIGQTDPEATARVVARKLANQGV